MAWPDDGTAQPPPATLTRVAAAHLLAAPLLRLALGRWPAAAEAARFRDAVARPPSGQPALLRGLIAVPAVRDRLRFTLRAEPSPAPARLPPPAARPGRGVAVLHVEKTGGTSLGDWLATAIPGASAADAYTALPAHLFAPLPTDASETPLLQGHFDLPTLRRVGGDRFTVLVLREPRRRILSLYRFLRACDPARLPPWQRHPGLAAAQDCDLLGFLRHPDPAVQDFIADAYVRRLTGRHATGAARDPLAADPAGALATAVDALHSIDFVGLTEAMPATLARLAAALGHAPPSAAPRRNVLVDLQQDPESGFRPLAAERLTPAVARELRRLTALDSVIYRLACLRFARA